MICEVYDWSGENKIREEQRTPQCSENFCDTCGDCLACYSGDGGCTSRTGRHRWVHYQTPDEHPREPKP